MDNLRQAAQKALIAVLEEAFHEGYFRRATYNDVDVSDVDEEWQEAKPSLTRALRAALEQPQQEPTKVPGMAVQALAGEIIAALRADETEGYDLAAGLFGAEFSKLVRRWANAEWALLSSSEAPRHEPVAWWKRHRDGTVELNEYQTFIAEDALATGRRPLVFGDTIQQPAREWVGLTDEEIVEAIKASDKVSVDEDGWIWKQRIKWSRAIEAKLKEKNRG